MDTTVDPRIKSLVQAIGAAETGPQSTPQAYQQKGASGEFGRYQFLPDTYKQYAQKYLGDSNAAPTVENQNRIAYSFVKEKKDNGYNPAQIASMWNAGEGKPDAYKNNYSGTNAEGVQYDTPAYVKKVSDYYKQFSAGEAPQDLSSSQEPQQPAQLQQDTYGAIAPASPNDNPLVAGAKSLANVPSSLLNLGKSLFSAITHPIHTIKGLGNAFAGGIEEGYHALTGTPASDNTQTETFNALKQSFVDRYGSLENAQRTATNDPVGFGADVFSILEGGAGLAKATTGLDAVNALDKSVTSVASPVINAGEKVTDLAGTATSKILGQSTGVGSESIKTAYNAGKEGGVASEAFLKGLRGETTGENLVEDARKSLDEIVQTRSDNYKTMLSSLKSDTTKIDINPVKEQLDKTLKNFNITKDAKGKLNFNESTIVNPSDQQKVTAITKDISGWKNTTPEGIDTLKQRIANYYEPGSKIGAFSESLRSVTRKLIEDTPGYTPAMKNYSELSDTIKDIKQGLSLGDKAAVETSINKLKGVLKSNNEFRRQVLAELDAATGGKLTQSIAGVNMNSLTPKGLAKYADIAGGAAAISHGVSILPVLGLAITTSPRIVGEFVRALGVGAKGTKIVLDTLNKVAKPAAIGATAIKDTTSK